VKSITVEASEPRDIEELRKLCDELPDGSAGRLSVEDEIHEQQVPASKPF